MHIKNTFTADDKGITGISEFISQKLKEYKVEKKEQSRASLVVEEAAGSLVKHAPAGSMITVILKSFLGSVTVELFAPGDDYSLADNMLSASLNFNNESDVQDTIRNIILGSMSNDLKYRHSNGRNCIRMTIVKSRHAFLYMTLGAMAAAVLFGLVFASFVPAGVNTTLNTYLLTPVKTMYMNALKMVVAPVVFFSIISCIVQFSDLSALGRIGAKIIGPEGTDS